LYNCTINFCTVFIYILLISQLSISNDPSVPLIHLSFLIFDNNNNNNNKNNNKIDISLQATLEDLKHQISKLKSIEPKFQRVFHLGREIKNSRRSLHALGIGRYGAFVVHLHSSKPKVIELATEKKSVDVAVASNQVVEPATTGATTTRNIASSRNSARGRKRSRVTAPVSGSVRSGRMNRVNSNMPSGGGGFLLT